LFHLASESRESLAHLAQHEPVRWNPGAGSKGFWAVTGHAEARGVLIDPETFSSDWRLGGFRIFDLQEVSALPRPTLLSLDGQQHLELRRALMPLFSPQAIAALEDRIQARARDLVLKVAPLGQSDFVTDLASPMAMGLLLDMLEVGSEMVPRLRQWMNVFIGDDDPEFVDEPAIRRQAISEFDAWACEEIARRRVRPGNDLLSRLMSATIDGAPLDFDGITTNLAAFMIAAQETTRHSMTHTMLLLHDHPDLREQLKDEPSRVDSMVKEFVRLASPIMHTRRTATRDVQLGGQHVNKGDRVVVWLGAANRDPRTYDQPHNPVLDGGARVNSTAHLAFGAGPHFCLGWRLAELQLGAMIKAMMSILPDAKACGRDARLLSNFIYGWKSLPITFTPA